MKKTLQKFLVGACSVLVLALGLPSIVAPAASAAAPIPDTPIWGNVPAAIYAAHLKPSGSVPLGKTLKIMLGLRAQNVQQMQSLAGQTALGMRKPLSAASFGTAYGASSSTIQEITSYLSGYGIHVTRVWPDNLMIEAQGTAAQIEQAFAVRLDQYSFHGKTVYSNNSEPRLPSAFASDVMTIGGLSDLGIAHPMITRLPSMQTHPAQLENYYRGLVPTQIRAAYNVSPAIANHDDGTGQSIGILALSPPSNGNLQDVGVWDAQWGLNPSNVTLLGSSDYLDPMGEAETNLDIGWSSAMAPGAQIRVYQGNNDNNYALEEDLQSVLSDPQHPGVLSVSWGIWEDLIDPSQIAYGDQLWAQAAAEGISTLVATGDYGSYDPYTGANSVDYPADDPFVTGVGGTNATVSAQGTITSEDAWGDNLSSLEPGLFLGSGGGYSTYLPAPTWQGGALPAGQKMRGVPDVAMNAVGYEIYDSAFGGWSSGFLGTSFAAPITAGIIADADTARGAAIGFLNPALYALASGKLGLKNPFNDITTGSNGAYSAGPGWDAATGLGSINAWTLVQDLAKIATTGTQGISFMTPTSGGAGTIVTVDGSGFGSSGTLTVGGTPIDSSADPNYSWTNNQVTFTFPTTVSHPGPVTIGLTPAGGNTYTDTFTATNQLVVQPGPPTEVTLTGASAPTLQPVVVSLEGPNGQVLSGSSDAVNLQYWGWGDVSIYADSSGQTDITSQPTLQLQNGSATFYVADDGSEMVEYDASDITSPFVAPGTGFGEFDPGPAVGLADAVGNGVYGFTSNLSVTQSTYADLYSFPFDANYNWAGNVEGNVYYSVGGSAVILPGGQYFPEPLVNGIADAQIGDTNAETAPVTLTLPTPSGDVTLQDTITFTPAAQIGLQPQSSTTTADGGFTVTASVYDSAGNTVTSNSDLIAVYFCDAQGYCKEAQGQAMNGVATIDVPVTGLSGPGTLQAYDYFAYNGDLQDYVQSGAVPVTVLPDPPSQLYFNQPWTVTTAPSGTAPQSAFQVVQAQTLDDYLNPSPESPAQDTAYLSIDGATGNLTVDVMQGGQLTPVGMDGEGSYEAPLDSTGTATWYVSDTSPETLNYQVYVNDANLSGNPGYATGTFTALTPSQLAMQVSGPTSTGGYQPVAVTVADASGNTVYTANDQIALAVSGAQQGTVSLYQSTGSGYQAISPDANGNYDLAASQGVATFYVHDTANGTLSYSATDLTTPGLTAATGSGSFTASAPATMSFSITPSTVATEGTATLSGTVLDQAGNPISGQSVTLQATTGNLATTTATTDQNGQFSVQWTAPATAGAAQFTAQTGSITATASAQVVQAQPGQSLPLTITGFTILDAQHNALPQSAELTAGQQYYLQMTVQNSSAQSYVPLFLIEATSGGQVLSLGSVQTSIGAGGSAAVTVLFTPTTTGTVSFLNLVWSNWLNLGGIPLGAKLAESSVVQP